MDGIEQIAEAIIAREGGYVNDKDDPGGATKFGVTIGTMRRLGMDLNRDGAITTADVRALTKEQAKAVFLKEYFEKPRITDIAEVFRQNAEKSGERDASYAQAALAQFGAEFAVPRLGWFDRFMDGVNRLPRPALAMGTIGLFVVAMVDPVWFASRMQGIALVPEPMWWLMGAIVSFYFGARSQAKSSDFQRSIAETLARAGTVANNIRVLDALDAGAGVEPAAPVAPRSSGDNPALDAWRQSHAG